MHDDRVKSRHISKAPVIPRISLPIPPALIQWHTSHVLWVVCSVYTRAHGKCEGLKEGRWLTPARK